MSQFLSLLSILNYQSIKESGATNLEFSLAGALADLYELGIGTASLLEEIPDIGNLLWHLKKFDYIFCF